MRIARNLAAIFSHSTAPSLDLKYSGGGGFQRNVSPGERSPCSLLYDGNARAMSCLDHIGGVGPLLK